MSIRTRLEDAQYLSRSGRFEGTILSLLVAVAATSRRRYPKNKQNKMGDKAAFIKFVNEEMATIIQGATGKSDIYILPMFTYFGETMSLGELLYRFVRCSLAHEGILPKNIKFVKCNGLSIKVNNNEIVFSESMLNGLFHAVIKAPENADLFPNGSME